MSPDIVNKIVTEAGYKVIKSSLDMDSDTINGNLYYERDIVLLL